MFTGIIQTVGQMVKVTPAGTHSRMRFDLAQLKAQTIALGDSICTNGVCLTAIALNNGSFDADVSAESLSKSTLGGLQVGDAVNLELAMRPTDRFGGHMVSGHVDGVGQILQQVQEGAHVRYRLRAPEALSRYIAMKGSITIDGVSLTVNRVEGAEFEINIVPHTKKSTIFAHYRDGMSVNLEVDLVARYLERLLQSPGTSPSTGVTLTQLAAAGFIEAEHGQ